MPRLTHADRREILDQWRRSGLAAPDFAVACGVSAATLYRWRRDAGPALVEIVEPRAGRDASAASALSAVAAPGSIDLVLPGGAVVRVAPGFDVATLRRLVEALA